MVSYDCPDIKIIQSQLSDNHATSLLQQIYGIYPNCILLYFCVEANLSFGRLSAP